MRRAREWESQWQLPVKTSPLTNNYWIHKWAKYHYFVGMNSLCDKYRQDTENFETNIEQEELDKDPSRACKVCYQRKKKGK